MILDTIKNIETYKNLSQDIYEGLKFIANVKPDIIAVGYPPHESQKIWTQVRSCNNILSNIMLIKPPDCN